MILTDSKIPQCKKGPPDSVIKMALFFVSIFRKTYIYFYSV